MHLEGGCKFCTLACEIEFGLVNEIGDGLN